MSGATCRICGNGGENHPFVAREMMIGTREEFEYFECSKCGAIQILCPPDDLSRFYREVYYAFGPPGRSWLKASLKRMRSRFAFTGRGLLGRALTRAYGFPQIVGWLQEWISIAGLTPSDELLDVGCGNGLHFPDLMDLGYVRLTGLDPFIEAPVDYGCGVQVLKMDLGDLDRQFDFVMMHHSFEHVPDPRATLRDLSRVVKRGRYALIRTPLAGSYAWRTYRADWVELDPPRHLVIQSLKSMQLLVSETDFEVRHVVFDSEEFQFWGSELYRRGMPLCDARSPFVTRHSPLFSAKERAAFRARARILNREKDGDSVGFYLFKK